MIDEKSQSSLLNSTLRRFKKKQKTKTQQHTSGCGGEVGAWRRLRAGWLGRGWGWGVGLLFSSLSCTLSFKNMRKVKLSSRRRCGLSVSFIFYDLGKNG